MLNIKGVKVTASTDVIGEESSAITLITKDETEFKSEKWSVSDFQNKKANTWVLFEFSNPLLIRGYGIMTSQCEEEEEQSEEESERRDPKKF